MPAITRWTIRAAMFYLVAGMILGALYWINTVWDIWPPLVAFNPVYIHLIVVGWLTQLIFGVVYWMFPIIDRHNMRGDPRVAWMAFLFLNAGLLLRAVCEPWRVLEPSDLNGIGLAIAALLQVIGAWLLVAASWRRVREKAGR